MDGWVYSFGESQEKDICDFMNGSVFKTEWSQMNKPQTFDIHWKSLTD